MDLRSLIVERGDIGGIFREEISEIRGILGRNRKMQRGVVEVVARTTDSGEVLPKFTGSEIRVIASKSYMSEYTALSQRLEGRAATTSGAAPLTSTGLNIAADSSLSESYHLVPRPTPYDTDSRNSRLQRDGLVSRRVKAMIHNQDDSQMLRRNSRSSGVEHLGDGKKRNNTDSEDCKASRSESEKNLYAKMSYGTAYTITSAEDEDVCPTCLEEYTPENPKIVTKCSHHLHLCCIYEWMERSDDCPICGKILGDVG